MTEPEFTPLRGDQKAVMPDGPPVELEPVEAPQPAAPKEASEAAVARVLGSMLQDRDSFAKLVDMLRNVHGLKVAHLSDEEIADLARDTYTEIVRESVERAFRNTGREVELKIKLDGF